jgi:hypothetical protein
LVQHLLPEIRVKVERKFKDKSTNRAVSIVPRELFKVLIKSLRPSLRTPGISYGAYAYYQSVFHVFGLDFTAGLLQAALKVSCMVPSIGACFAELIKAPVMLLANFYSARLIVLRFHQVLPKHSLLAVGFISLSILLAIEFTIVLSIRNQRY